MPKGMHRWRDLPEPVDVRIVSIYLFNSMLYMYYHYVKCFVVKFMYQSNVVSDGYVTSALLARSS